MDNIISDSAQAEVSQRVKDILRASFIEDWKSEAYHQHQNYDERRYKTIKRHTTTLLNRSIATPTPGC